ncbi:MAG: 50S ribosomal protein L18 [Candidatus Krumholzibacteriia bacterium]
MISVSKKRRAARLQRKVRVRRKIRGTAERPRVTVFRSHRNIYAQVVDDDQGRTLLSFDGNRDGECEVPEGLSAKCAKAYVVGRGLAGIAKEKGITAMVFDRNGYLYHGRVAALARGLRDGGIEV